jgi:hypothetical protein
LAIINELGDGRCGSPTEPLVLTGTMPSDGFHHPIVILAVLDVPETYKACMSMDSPRVPKEVEAFHVQLCHNCSRQKGLRVAKGKRISFIRVIEFRAGT